MSNQKIAMCNAFMAAGQHLENTGFICIALDCARSRGEITTSECNNAQKLVRERIEDMYTLDAWCKEYIPGLSDLWKDDPWKAACMIQEFRTRWLNHLIEEFE